jgi:hypothetical protein
MATLIDLSQWLNHTADHLQPEAAELEQAAEHQKQRILDRTAQGVGVDLQAFPGYQIKSKENPPVELRRTGAMLDSITVEANSDQARIFFADSKQAEIASYHNTGTRKMQERHFFGASLSDHEEIVSDVRSALFKRVNG